MTCDKYHMKMASVLYEFSCGLPSLIWQRTLSDKYHRNMVSLRCVFLCVLPNYSCLKISSDIQNMNMDILPCEFLCASLDELSLWMFSDKQNMNVEVWHPIWQKMISENCQKEMSVWLTSWWTISSNGLEFQKIPLIPNLGPCCNF